MARTVRVSREETLAPKTTLYRRGRVLRTLACGILRSQVDLPGEKERGNVTGCDRYPRFPAPTTTSRLKTASFVSRSLERPHVSL